MQNTVKFDANIQSFHFKIIEVVQSVRLWYEHECLCSDT